MLLSLITFQHLPIRRELHRDMFAFGFPTG